MGRQFDEDDEEYIELLKHYEKYIRTTPGAYEDFDEWLEIEYYGLKSKIHKKSKRRKRKVEE
jgi:hypothetical protein